jgi:hypothetical protein
MSSVPPREYEFSPDQNALFGALASHMRLVGLFLAVVGVLNILAALVIVVAIYRAKLPQSYVDSVLQKASEASKTDVKAQLDKLPPDDHLWGLAIGGLVNGLLYLLIGVWTRNAAGSFQQIVDTRGHDISHLMHALGSLNKMYTLIYTLIVIGLLLFLITLGLFLFAQFSR